MHAPPPGLVPAFAAAGIAATAAQVLLLRELLVSAAGDEAALGTGLAAWLAGIALGAAVRRHGFAGSFFSPGALLSLLAGAGGAGIVALRLLRVAAAPPAGELPGLGLVLLLASTSLFPSGALVGASFAALGAHAATLRPPGDALAQLYVAESIGSLAAGAGASLLVGTLLPPLAAALLAGLAAALLLLASALPAKRPALAAAVLLSLGTAASRPLDQATERLRFAALSPAAPLVAIRDTPHAHLALGGEPRELWENGAFSATFPDPYASEALAHLSASLAPAPHRILALGAVERGVLRFLLQHSPERVDLVVADPPAFSFVRDRLPREDLRALRDPRVHLVADDPRRFLSRTRGEWDLILLFVPDPVTLGRARLLTGESFRAAAAHLAHRGAFVVSLRTAAATLPGSTAALGGSVFGALRSAFPVVRATPGPDTLLVAGFDGSAVTLDPSVVAARFRGRHIASDSFVPELLPLLLAPDNVARVEAALSEASRHVPPSRDDRPVSLLFALARRQQETPSVAGRPFAALGRLPAPLLAALVLLPSAAFAGRALATPPAAGPRRPSRRRRDRSRRHDPLVSPPSLVPDPGGRALRGARRPDGRVHARPRRRGGRVASARRFPGGLGPHAAPRHAPGLGGCLRRHRPAPPRAGPPLGVPARRRLRGARRPPPPHGRRHRHALSRRRPLAPLLGRERREDRRALCDRRPPRRRLRCPPGRGRPRPGARDEGDRPPRGDARPPRRGRRRPLSLRAQLQTPGIAREQSGHAPFASRFSSVAIPTRRMSRTPHPGQYVDSPACPGTFPT
ncbi:MAG: hypothetical protein IPP07_22580 [Holophagales bacterium]|nr:hypothetical protein [Holophagales bacterium]